MRRSRISIWHLPSYRMSRIYLEDLWLREEPLACLDDQFLVLRFQLQLVIAVRLSVSGWRIAQFVLRPQVLADLREYLSQAHGAGDRKYMATSGLRELLQYSQSGIF